MTMTHVPVTALLSPLEAATEALPLTVAASPIAAAALVPARSQRPVVDVVEEWGLASFPASDPPSNW